MKRLIVILAVAVALGAFADGAPAPKKKISPEKLRETIRKVQAKKTGGIVRKEGSAKGTFVVVNAQRRVSESDLAPVAETLGQWMHVQAKVVSAEAGSVDAKAAKAAISKAGGVLGVAVVEGDGPTLLVAPEDGWALVDAAALAKDGADAKTLAARVRKEALRAFAFVSGGAYMARGEPLMRDVKSVKDLDAVASEQFGIDMVVHVRESAAFYGLTPWQQATYLKACEQGWAPAPTNEYQKAIWDKVHEMPTEPIKIKPEMKKVKE